MNLAENDTGINITTSSNYGRTKKIVCGPKTYLELIISSDVTDIFVVEKEGIFRRMLDGMSMKYDNRISLSRHRFSYYCEDCLLVFF